MAHEHSANSSDSWRGPRRERTPEGLIEKLRAEGIDVDAATRRAARLRPDPADARDKGPDKPADC
jgi:hypothetical protein